MEILKKGSEGNSVVLWQEFLKETGFYSAKIDGDFGNLTELATISFQKKYFLQADGVVGGGTYSLAYKLGFLCSDDDSNEEIFKKYFLPENEYRKGEGSNDWVCMHQTAGWNNPYATIDQWGRDTRGEVATEFVIGGQKITDGDSKYDGEALQCFPEGIGAYGWHLGTGNSFMHRNTVGLELNNFGYLTKGGFNKRIDGKSVFIQRKKDHLYTYVGTEIAPDSNQVVKLSKEFRGFEFWHKYSDDQLKKSKEILKYIENRDSIDIRRGLPDLIRQKGISAFDIVDTEMCKKIKGLWSHTNLTKTKFDIFPQEEMVDMLLSL
jgi:hypothetical protein